VVAGQQLGLIGNSGNSSEPHLHVHMVDSTNTWQPMKFDRGQTTSFASGSASLNGPWTALKGNSLPMATILIWPPHPIGNWTHNGIDSAGFQRIFDHYVDSGMMADTITCKNNGATYFQPTVNNFKPAAAYEVKDQNVIGAMFSVRRFF